MIEPSDYTIYIDGAMLVNDYNNNELVVINRNNGVSIRISVTDGGLSITASSATIQLASTRDMLEVLFLARR